MARLPRSALQVALGTPSGCSVAILALALISFHAALPFLLPSAQRAPQIAAARAPQLLGAAAAGAPQRLPRPQVAAPSGGLAVVAAAAAAGVAAAAAARAAGRRRGHAPARRSPLVARRAEDDEEPGFSLDKLIKEDEQEEAERQEAESELFESLGEGDLTGVQTAGEDAEQEAADIGSRQENYDINPSPKYVHYIARKNAIATWTKDGPGGKNTSCLEVKIAVITEKIRNMVLHAREHPKDTKCRVKLVPFVAKRRRLLDRLAWGDLDAYLKIREELKIRHTYRMEALIGRLPEYKYTDKNRIKNPGKPTIMRLKKIKRLLQRRLANNLKAGRSNRVIHKIKNQNNLRSWVPDYNHETKLLLKGRPLPDRLDPLNMP